MPAKQSRSSRTVNIHINMGNDVQSSASIVTAAEAEANLPSALAASQHPMAAHLRTLHALEERLLQTRNITRMQEYITLALRGINPMIWEIICAGAETTIGPITDEAAFKHPLAAQLRTIRHLIDQFRTTRLTYAQDILLRQIRKAQGHLWDILLYGDILGPASPDVVMMPDPTGETLPDNFGMEGTVTL